MSKPKGDLTPRPPLPKARERKAKIAYGIILVVILLVAGCAADDMAVQAKCPPLGEIQDFKDGACAQPLPEGVVAADAVVDNDALTSGKVNGQYVTTIPIALSESVLERGQNRFNIYCQPCHGTAGYGDGVLTKFEFPTPPSFQTDDSRSDPAGFFFDVISNGTGLMYPYASQLDAPDRWAVVAYIRALQLSQYAPARSLPPSDQEQLPQ